MCLPDWVAEALAARRLATMQSLPVVTAAFIHALPKETIKR